MILQSSTSFYYSRYWSSIESSDLHLNLPFYLFGLFYLPFDSNFDSTLPLLSDLRAFICSIPTVRNHLMKESRPWFFYTWCWLFHTLPLRVSAPRSLFLTWLPQCYPISLLHWYLVDSYLSLKWDILRFILIHFLLMFYSCLFYSSCFYCFTTEPLIPFLKLNFYLLTTQNLVHLSQDSIRIFSIPCCPSPSSLVLL